MTDNNENQYPQPTAPPTHPYNPYYQPPSAGQQPSQAQPVMAQPVNVQSTEPVVAQPVTAQPVVGQPVMAYQQPVMAQTVTAQPVMAQPATMQPVTAQPMVGHTINSAQQPVMAQAFVPPQYQQQPQSVAAVPAQIYNPHAAAPSLPPPPLSNPSAWFDYYDKDRSGSLNKSEVTQGLIFTLGAKSPSEQHNLQGTVNSIWNIFDTDGNGTLDKREFCAPGGFGESLQAAMNSNNSIPTHHQPAIRIGGGGTGTVNAVPGVYVPNASSVATTGAAAINNNTTTSIPGVYVPNSSSSAATTTTNQKIRVGIPQGSSPGQRIKIKTPAGKSEIATIPPRSQWVFLNTGQAAFDYNVTTLATPLATAPATPAPTSTSTTIRVGIPQGTSAGQRIRIKTPAGASEIVTIPPRSQWVYLNTGQAAFDYKVTVAAAGTTTSASSMQAQPSSRHPWQQYEQITKSSYQSPISLGSLKTVPIGIGSMIQPSGRRRALVIGINYTGTRAALRGCINDAKNMRNVLIQKHAFPNDTCHMVMLTDEPSRGSNYQPTYSNIRRGLQWLLQGVAQGDMLFFHFSGHGAQVPDKTGHEADGLNETILPLDYERKQITDDELWGSIVYPLPAGARLTALMDCCHSGTGLDLPYEYNMYSQNNRRQYNSSSWVEDLNPAHSQGDVVLISGCKDDQTSADAFQQGTAGGAMTQAFLTAYEQHPYCTYPELLQAIHEALKRRRFTQRPQLTSSQPFNTQERIFSLEDGIEPNHQQSIGRIKKKHVRPGRTGGGSGADVGGMLLGGAGILGALALGDALFDF